LDAATGLYYYGYRYYDSQSGRFVSKDVAAAINQYIYASDNPNRYTDPSGAETMIGSVATGEPTTGPGSTPPEGWTEINPGTWKYTGPPKSSSSPSETNGGTPGPGNIDLASSEGLGSVANGGTPGPANIDLASSRGIVSVAGGGTPGPGNIDLLSGTLGNGSNPIATRTAVPVQYFGRGGIVVGNPVTYNSEACQLTRYVLTGPETLPGLPPGADLLIGQIPGVDKILSDANLPTGVLGVAFDFEVAMLAPSLAAGVVPGVVDLAAIGITVGVDLYFEGAFGNPCG
jgi:hypothetical protein